MIVAYVDAFRFRFGVEPICRVLSEHDVPILGLPLREHLGRGELNPPLRFGFEGVPDQEAPGRAERGDHAHPGYPEHRAQKPAAGYRFVVPLALLVAKWWEFAGSSRGAVRGFVAAFLDMELKGAPQEVLGTVPARTEVHVSVHPLGTEAPIPMVTGRSVGTVAAPV